MSKQKSQEAEPGADLEELEALYSEEYLGDCASGEARAERLEELKRRIKLGAYKVDPDWVAEHLLDRGDLSKK